MRQLILWTSLVLFTLGIMTTTTTAGGSLPDGLYAQFDTNKGKITVQLFFKRAPMTVGNFVGLAEGDLPWTHPGTGKSESGSYYNGLVFHRVIDEFMIQGGDPLGRGTGGPGYSFPDEFNKDLTHAKPGMLSMANSGPNTNGSQFFITHVPTPWLDGKHTVFGTVVEGMDIVNAIKAGDAIKTLTIDRVGKEAKDFDAAGAFKSGQG